MSELAIAVVGTLIAALIWAEFEAWTPRLTAWITKFAARRSPAQLRDRLEEEWLAHVHSTPGRLSPVIVAIGFSIAASRLNRECSIKKLPYTPVRGRRRAINFVVALPAAVAIAPLVFWIVAYAKLTRRGPLLHHTRIRFPDGTIGLFSSFNIVDDPVSIHSSSKFGVLRIELSKLAQIWNVLRGQLDMVYVSRLLLERELRRPSSFGGRLIRLLNIRR